MRKTGGVMSSRGKGIQPQGKKEKGKKGYKGVTPVDKIKNRLAQREQQNLILIKQEQASLIELYLKYRISNHVIFPSSPGIQDR